MVTQRVSGGRRRLDQLRVVAEWSPFALGIGLFAIALVAWAATVISAVQQFIAFAAGHPEWTATFVYVSLPTVGALLFVASPGFVRLYEAARWWMKPNRGSQAIVLRLPRRCLSSDPAPVRNRRILGRVLLPQRGLALAVAASYCAMVWLRTTAAGDQASLALGDYFAGLFAVGLLAGLSGIWFASQRRTSGLVGWMPLVVAAFGFGFAGVFVGGQVVDSLPTQVRDNLDKLSGGMTKASFEIVFAVPAAAYGIWMQLARIRERGLRVRDFRIAPRRSGHKSRKACTVIPDRRAPSDCP